MARKVANRKELRKEVEAAEAAEAKGTKKKKAAKKKTAAPRKTRKKADTELRMKLFWGVFNQSLRRVALFEYSQRRQAEKKAKELSDSQKTPHFVQLVKEVIEE